MYIHENICQVYAALFKEKSVISMKDLKMTTTPKVQSYDHRKDNDHFTAMEGIYRYEMYIYESNCKVYAALN